ncbi:GDP-mannose 4,6-dehydratase [Metapseudomonas otitidis]|uniref:GDP-mannose 4,6-dehydratase n=1 Tax=Metapseudomonas otitidis TaxID=319939 RepID=UPI00398C6CB7
MASTAFITGITGQDGSYLAEFLLAKGYRVIGGVRAGQGHSALISELAGRIELVVWDMSDQDSMSDVLAQYQPHEFYNCAAYSSGSGMYDNPVDLSDVNGISVVRTLEAIRAVDARIRFCQASSREIFGGLSEGLLTEASPTLPRSPYGVAKLYADLMVRIYRQHYGIFACSAILFNHESPRRGLGFVTRKITHEAVKIKLGLSNELSLGNLEARRDWGFAGDYVRAMWLMLQQKYADDYIVATGVTHSVRELCDLAFGYLGLDYRSYVQENSSLYRPAEPSILVGSAAKANAVLGWSPEVAFDALVRMMVDADMRILSDQTPIYE